MPQNSWYDEECREMRIRLHREVLMGITTRRQSQIIFRRLVRRKKRAYLSQLDRDLYQLFMSQDLGEAWRLFHEHSPPPAITSTETWGEYATSLFTTSGLPPLPDPLEPCSETCPFYTAERVRKAIDRMKTGRAHDHDGLVAEHFIHARDMLVELLAMMFNRAMHEGFLETWSMSTIVPIFKAGDPMVLGNYRTIVVGMSLAQIGEFAFVLLSRASNMHLVEDKLYLLLLGTTALSLVTTPLLFKFIPVIVHLGILMGWFSSVDATSTEVIMKGENHHSGSSQQLIVTVQGSQK
ncbi:hypothetical protein L7F22_017262 [Adiantum nelumboides]|nr:hypothetical protein [Adiantum nelumboides]